LSGYTVPTVEPTEIRAGDLVTWKKTLSDYPADEWTLKYALRGEGAGTAIDITTTASGTDHLVSVAKATTAAWTAGIYKWVAYVDNIVDPLQRHTLESGTIKILPDLVAAASTYDTRSHVKKVLDSVEAAILTLSAKTKNSVLILGNQYTLQNMGDLIKLRDKYKTEYQREIDAEKIAQGIDNPRRIGIRLVR